MFRRATAEKIAGEASWADARTTLFRAQLLGHNPTAALRAVAATATRAAPSNPGRNWRGCYVTTSPPTPTPG